MHGLATSTTQHLPRVVFVSDPSMEPERHTVIEVDQAGTLVRVRTTREEMHEDAPAHLNAAIAKNIRRGTWRLGRSGLYVPRGSHIEPAPKLPLFSFKRQLMSGRKPVAIIETATELLVLVDVDLLYTDEAARFMTEKVREHMAERWQRGGGGGWWVTST